MREIALQQLNGQNPDIQCLQHVLHTSTMSLLMLALGIMQEVTRAQTLGACGFALTTSNSIL